jgi:methionine-S-sulfoxide reductase
MTEKVIFAGGCFWGVQAYFDQVPGVVSTVVGYTGGHTEHPTYEEVCSHTTGHAEACEIAKLASTSCSCNFSVSLIQLH